MAPSRRTRRSQQTCFGQHSKPRKRVLFCGSLAAVLAVSGCSTSPAVKAASSGNRDQLRVALSGDQPPSPSELREVARVQLDAEIRRATSQKDRAFIPTLRACAGALRPALKNRSSAHDGLGAAAALMLFESGHPEGFRPSQFAQDSDGGWRALAARATKDDAQARQAFLSDPDERVRLAAVSASVEAKDAHDIPELLELSRRDPSPLIRSKAIDALGQVGGEATVQSLKDRYVSADEPLRLAIVAAYASPPLLPLGGAVQLEQLVDRGEGFVALHAAYLLSRLSTSDYPVLVNKGAARLFAFAKDGTIEERRLALRWLPENSSETRARLLEVSQESSDPAAQVIAWAILLKSTTTHDAARDALYALATTDVPEAYEARRVLSVAGDERVLPLLVAQAKAADPVLRRMAGTALLAMGAHGEFGPLLGDESPSVWRPLACQLLAQR